MRINLSGLSNLFHFKRTDFKTSLLEPWHNLKIRILLISALFVNLINWLVSILINVRIKEDIIALHYNVYFGINLIGSPKQIYFIPLLGLLVIIINLIFAYLIRREDNFFIYLFTVASILVNVFLLLGLGAVMLINFR